MSPTVDKLGDQLTVKNVFNALLDKADENGIDAHYLLEAAKLSFLPKARKLTVGF